MLCQRCTRFSEEIAGDKFIDLMEPVVRRADQHLPGRRVRRGGRRRRRPVQLVLLRQHRADLPGRRAHRRPVPVPGPPVRPGLHARASASTARPAAPSAPTSGGARCCAGWPATTRRSTRSGTATRAGGASSTPRAFDRLTTPLVRDAKTGELREASWSEALRGRRRGAARGPRRRSGSAVLTGGRLTVEDAYAYAKFARVALNTNDIDFRARPVSARGGRLPGQHASPGSPT